MRTILTRLLEGRDMNPEDLELFSTQELVDELMRRQTFLGVVIHSEEDFKNDQWSAERIFKIHFNGNLGAEEACRLLSRVADHMESSSN
jgi:hypothetical protein